MLEDHAKDLINRAIDGELSDAERAECQSLLDSSDEARAYSENMSRLTGLLGEVGSIDPPPELEGRILKQIQLPRPRKWFTWTAGWMQGRPMAYGMAAAAGLMVAVAFYELAPQSGMENDISSLVGTLARGNGQQGLQQLSFLDIDLPAVQGKVYLSSDEDLKMLRFDLESEAPVEFEVALEGSGLAFGGFVQEADAGNDNFSLTESSFSVINQGERRFTVILRDGNVEPTADGGIVVSVSREGEALYQGVLKL